MVRPRQWEVKTSDLQLGGRRRKRGRISRVLCVGKVKLMHSWDVEKEEWLD